MQVFLDAISFNHDPLSASADALNIRRNTGQFVSVPEWRRGISVNPEDSPAAYSIADTRGHQLTIQAKLHCTDCTHRTIWVRARDVTFSEPGCLGCLAFLWPIVLGILTLLFGNVLGRVRARQVTFDTAGETGFETFVLQNVKLWRAGVGARTTVWQWEYRIGKGPWKPFQTTRHRIYSLVETPKTPWQQTPYDPGNVQLPWTEVMDHACAWAVLATTTDVAAAGVTRGVFELGPAIVTYDCPGGGSSHYADPGFNCTAFLDRLRGGIGNGIYVNCTDCATIMSSFANVLGCDLWQSRMGYSFDLNEILAIGSAVWQTACGWGSFSYHEVAWKGACTAGDAIFDACLEVDGDADPTSAPHTPLLPVNLGFGNPGDGLYRDRLATPVGRLNCNPQPGTKQRRAVY
ncbi:MAG TPA: hypothetical protein VF221_10295 [Chloroflexota bacterium]